MRDLVQLAVPRPMDILVHCASLDLSLIWINMQRANYADTHTTIIFSYPYRR